jgi:hypothetical protein
VKLGSPAEVFHGACRMLSRARFLPDGVTTPLRALGQSGMRPNYARPTSLHEKMVWTLLHGDEALRAQWADKIAAKDLARSVVPWLDVAPILTAGARGEDLDLAALPERSVLKPNNNSQRIRILQRPFDAAEVIALANRWLALDPSADRPAWERHYRRIPPRVFVEAYLGDDPTRYYIHDHRVFVFHGRAEFVWMGVYDPRGGLHTLQVDRDHRLLAWPRAKRMGARPTLPDASLLPPRPQAHEAILAAAEAIAAPFPFARVDFYLQHGKVYFGEVTFAPSGTFLGFPPDLDRELGRLLRVP